MIPLKLELTNFLSYRSPVELDFHGIHLACITGPNGSGKSSILDAITWSMFGRSRSKSDDDVVNRLASIKDEETIVGLSFELEGITYRIIRRKKAGKRMLLEFQVATDDGNWKPISESRLRDTQVAINDLLKMNFDTFINSSFLLQGKADEFTIRTPNKRKEILADLLGVNEWDRYKELAGEQRRTAENRLLLVEGRLGDIDRELATRPERQAALSRAMETLEHTSKRLELQETLLTQARRSETARQQQEQAVKNLNANLEQVRRRLTDLRTNQKQRQDERDEHQVLLDQSAEIRAEYSQWQSANKLAEEWRTKAESFHAIQQEKRPYELALERERSRLSQRKSELEAQEKRLGAMEEERSKLVETLKAEKKRLAEIEAILSEILEKHQTWQTEHDKLLQMESNRELLKQQASQLAEKARQITTQKEERSAANRNLEDAQKALHSITNELEEVNVSQQQLMLATADRDKLKVDQQRLKESMDNLKDRLDRLQVETGGECPLCGQHLSDEHCQEVLAQLENEGKRDADQYRQNQIQIKELQEEIPRLEQKVKKRGPLERDQIAQQKRLASAEARMAEIDRQVAEWEADGANRLREVEESLTDDSNLKKQQALVSTLSIEIEGEEKFKSERQSTERNLVLSEARLAEIDRVRSEWEGEPRGTGLAAELSQINEKLKAGDYELEAQAALAKLEDRARDLGYDVTEHQEAMQRRDELVEAEDRYQALQRAEAAVKPLDNNLADLATQITDQEQNLGQLEEQHEAALAQLASLTKGGLDLIVVEKETNQLREEQIEAHRKVATAQQNVSVLDELAVQGQDIKTEQNEVRQRIRRLKLLETACGREGVQALLIERALPEIEDDANELLSRLTSGQMQIIFETQRKLKTSDRLAETLDIHIVDAAGERPYENFSGGEQFRVNFAIRLALSKILTRRAGARLQTLVIDEGFGSQDPEGRQRLIEAINIIQDDFERVLVITHIEEMQDAFPTRIQVEKRPSGSAISVV